MQVIDKQKQNQNVCIRRYLYISKPWSQFKHRLNQIYSRSSHFPINHFPWSCVIWSIEMVLFKLHCDSSYTLHSLLLTSLSFFHSIYGFVFIQSNVYFKLDKGRNDGRSIWICSLTLVSEIELCDWKWNKKLIDSDLRICFLRFSRWFYFKSVTLLRLE